MLRFAQHDRPFFHSFQVDGPRPAQGDENRRGDYPRISGGRLSLQRRGFPPFGGLRVSFSRE